MTFKKILAVMCVIVTYVPLLITALIYVFFRLIYTGLVMVNMIILHNVGYVKGFLAYKKLLNHSALKE